VWYLKNITSGVIPTYLIVSIKNARFKCQPSTPMQSFISIRYTLFIEIDDKGERLVQRYHGKLDLDMDMDKEGATLKNMKKSKFLGKRSTQVGGASS
jgi:hypothetical protein